MPGCLIVRERRGASEARVAEALATSGLVVRRRLSQLDVSICSVAESECESARRSLEGSGLFRFVEHDYAARGGQVPNDPYYRLQWHLDRIDAEGAWEVTEGASGVPVAIIDSGVDPGHVELRSKVLGGWDFICDAPVANDHLGHGTSVAGVAAASTFNAQGVAGVAPRNPVIPLVVLDSGNVALYSDVARAIVYAADQGARVINLSLGGTTPSSLLQDAVDYAWSRGAVIFAAAMNDGSTTRSYPAACEHVQAIAATDPGDALASFSNHGSWIDFAAPGLSIYTTKEGGGYGYASGTSFASPIAAAVAALILSERPGLSAEGVVDVLRASSTDLGPPGFDAAYGWGRIDAAAALREALRR